ncbi:MAG: cryptochrome/photolyase family protein [Bacteroidia bacterium]|nr:cryptochrome/photolyase family protein [Bacteroidia bacterium]NNC86037.1 cryptochrome/photolyase family protein [Bacteroidia bacterium]NNM16798.1 cryptochrome/photolyase family protein [Bacteroidia bacterium]
MKSVNLIFPHQLVENNPLLKNKKPFYLIEEHLFFNQYQFHKQKIAFHRASMKNYEAYLQSQGAKTNYIEARNKNSDIRKLILALKKEKVLTINYIDTTDYLLEKRIQSAADSCSLTTNIFTSPLFINTPNELSSFFKPTSKKLFQTKFYISERKKRNILIDKKENPVGGKWSFDKENRKKYPKGKTPPQIKFPPSNDIYIEAVTYTHKYFKNNPGNLDSQPLYPVNAKQSKKWFKEFLKTRFNGFGTYEDAIVDTEHYLNHSIITPMLNTGMLTPNYVINETLKFTEKNETAINSLEGFVRQIVGWREFIRGVYESKGVEQRTKNYWKFKRKIPNSFYDGSTGIEPIDNTIHKLLKTGYCHHIERLMVLGNFMALCEFDPDEVYRWFMELFIDSYDWVMVPNVYGMSQFADGGLMATKPYISGSNYIMKMSNYKKGDWQEIWDALFWRFMHTHRKFFLKNPRMGLLIKTFDKMDEEKQKHLINTANNYLLKL